MQQKRKGTFNRRFEKLNAFLLNAFMFQKKELNH